MSNADNTHKLSRRAALGLIASGAGVALIAACAPSTSPAPAAPAATTASSGAGAAATAAPAAQAGAAAGATPQPKSGGTLRYGTGTDVNRLDPHFRLGDIYYTVYDRLTQYDINHNVQPMLAE